MFCLEPHKVSVRNKFYQTKNPYPQSAPTPTVQECGVDTGEEERDKRAQDKSYSLGVFHFPEQKQP